MLENLLLKSGVAWSMWRAACSGYVPGAVGVHVICMGDACVVNVLCLCAFCMHGMCVCVYCKCVIRVSKEEVVQKVWGHVYYGKQFMGLETLLHHNKWILKFHFPVNVLRCHCMYSVHNMWNIWCVWNTWSVYRCMGYVEWCLYVGYVIFMER